MITVNTNKTINIILPNTNKALQEVIKSASPTELQTLSKDKDLKSIINTIFQKSAKEPAQDKILLNLVKNNPTLKELGNVTNSVKDLLKTIQQAEAKTTKQEPLPLEKILKNFLVDIKDMSEKNLKTKLENSGVFLESKIKNIQNPKLVLKESMQELSKALESTKLPNVKTINIQLKELLATDLFKNISNNELLNATKVDIKPLTQLSKNVQDVLDKFSQRLNSQVDKSINPNDVLFSKDTKDILSKINILNKPEKLLPQIQVKDMFSQDLKSILLKAREEINASSQTNKQEILKQIDKLNLQIDYHQLVSHLSNSSSLYIPYAWDALEDGNISIKNASDDKFFTDIQLQLKEYGELKLRLGMFDKNQLNININVQSPKLKTILQENIPELKKQLFKAGITPKSIRFIDDTKTSHYDDASQNIAVGFEVKA